MLKIEINVRTKQDAHIIAMGTTEDILSEMSIIAGALTRELMQPFAAKGPAHMVKAMITGALLAGVDRGAEHSRQDAAKKEAASDG